MTATHMDRPTRIRRALLELVAERGFRGTSMAAVAERAGVAAGTAYVHYRSKDEVVLATYLEVKADLGRAAAAAIDPGAPPAQRFAAMWYAIHGLLAADRDQARFLIQVEASPYADAAHAGALENPEDELMAAAAATDMAELLVDLPPLVLYDLGIGPAVRLAAGGSELDGGALDRVAAACWRAITRA